MNVLLQIEKSQGEIYRLRAKLESTQTENENMHDELEKMQQALNRSYADRDKIASDLEKMRDELERSQVRSRRPLPRKKIRYCHPTRKNHGNPMDLEINK